MNHYSGNVLKYDRVSGWKYRLEKLRLFFESAPGVDSKEKTDTGERNEKTLDGDMKETLGGWWW